MTDIGVILNVPRDITLGGKTLKIRQLKLKEIFGYFQERILSKIVSNAQSLAKGMPSDIAIELLNKARQEMPSDQELTDMVTDSFASYEGISALLYLGSVDLNDDITSVDSIKDRMSADDLKSLIPIVNWLLGEEEEPEESEETAEKKT